MINELSCSRHVTSHRVEFSTLMSLRDAPKRVPCTCTSFACKEKEYIDETGSVQSGNLVAISTRNKHSRKDRQTAGDVSVRNFGTNRPWIYAYLLQEFQRRLLLSQDGAQSNDDGNPEIIQTDHSNRVGGTPYFHIIWGPYLHLIRCRNHSRFTFHTLMHACGMATFGCRSKSDCHRSCTQGSANRYTVGDAFGCSPCKFPFSFQFIPSSP